MSKVWQNTSNYNIISTPLTADELKNIKLNSNQLIISVPINDNNEDDENNINILITDNNGNALNITNNSSLQKMCNAFGEILNFQSNTNELFEFNVDNSYIQNIYIYNGNILSYNSIGYTNVSYSNCISVENYLTNDLFNSDIQYTSEVESNKVKMKNIKIIPKLPNDVETGIYLSYFNLKTPIPNIDKKITVKNIIVKDTLKLYYGFVSNSISEVFRNTYVNNGYTKYINDDYLISSDADLENNQTTFFNEIASVFNYKEVNSYTYGFYNNDMCNYVLLSTAMFDKSTYFNITEDNLAYSIIVQTNRLNINNDQLNNRIITMITSESLKNYCNYISVDTEKINKYYNNINDIYINTNLWVITPSILSYYYSNIEFIIFDNNTEVKRFKPIFIHEFKHDNKDYQYIEFGYNTNYSINSGLTLNDMSYYGKLLLYK